ncbi:MAG TPA: MFS transporter [Gaiellaceae bacterium]|nr:MFS transporter [Gaiellaceae bacterium]
MRLTLPLYAGGFLGPFGGAMLVALIPNVAAGLGTSLTLVAAAITTYMIPFAALQLVSGTVAERLGARRVVRTAYLVYGAAALVCALAPEIWTFLGARAVMGAANAFLSPILLAALSEVVAPEVLGRTVGTFAAWQTAGFMLAPALGGALGEVSWRLAFVMVTLAALALALPSRTLGTFEGARASEATLRALFNRWIALLSAKAILGYLGFTAIGFVLVLVAADEFGLGSGARGLLVAGYGLGGILLGRFAGSIVDRAGRPSTALAGTLACTAGVLGLAFAPSVWSLALVWLAVGCAATFVWAGLNTIAVESFPQNRAGATSAYSAFKFLGIAVGPLVYVPLFHVDTRAPFFVAAVFSLTLAALVVPWFARYRELTRVNPWFHREPPPQEQTS